MIKVLLRTLISYIAIIVSIRLMGKRQIGDMQPTELVVTLLIGELIAISLQDLGEPILLSLSSIFILVFLEVAVSFVCSKVPFIKRLLGGKPIVLINKGVIDQKAMAEVRMSSEDLLNLLHSFGTFDIEDVYCAVLEVNGTLSVNLKKEAQPLTLKAPQNSLPLLVVSNGKLITPSIKYLGLKKQDFMLLLKNKKANLKDIYFMTLDSGGNTVIINKTQTPQKENVQ